MLNMVGKVKVSSYQNSRETSGDGLVQGSWTLQDDHLHEKKFTPEVYVWKCKSKKTKFMKHFKRSRSILMQSLVTIGQEIKKFHFGPFLDQSITRNLGHLEITFLSYNTFLVHSICPPNFNSLGQRSRSIYFFHYFLGLSRFFEPKLLLSRPFLIFYISLTNDPRTLNLSTTVLSITVYQLQGDGI